MHLAMMLSFGFYHDPPIKSMLKNITVTSCPVFGVARQTMESFSKVNFLFGGNGSGKTTLAKIISGSGAPGVCNYEWHTETPPKVITFNTDFIKSNFKEQINGIFTIGKDQVDVLKELNEKVAAKEKAEGKKENLTGKLTEKTNELGIISNQFEESCWTVKKQYDGALSPAFEGCRKRREDFKNRVLAETMSSKSATFKPISVLVEQASTIFQDSVEEMNELQTFDFDSLKELHKTPLLHESIVGKDNPLISQIINRIGDSQWIHQGFIHLDVTGETCPFCQQTMPNNIRTGLEEMFDQSHKTKMAQLNTLQQAYKAEIDKLDASILYNKQLNHKFLSPTQIDTAAGLVKSVLQKNSSVILSKIKDPSTPVSFVSLDSALNSYVKTIQDVNDRVAENNEISRTLEDKQKSLKEEIWISIVSDVLADAHRTYSVTSLPVQKALDNIQSNLAKNEVELEKLNSEIQALRLRVRQSGPTVVKINRTLKSFGFGNFSLATSECGNFYQLVRKDGQDATHTLSEGEKNFVLFLYFFHSIQDDVLGDSHEFGKIVVIDDPVCSLDSDVLFIVANLIKGVLKMARSADSSIKQVFVHTHNLYFHKEVTYGIDRYGDINDITYWMIRKMDGFSQVSKFETNPVRTGYELLWHELQELIKNEGPYLLLPNCLRRILETYFKMFGNRDFHTIIAKFEGTDKVICGTLFSWSHDGSHGVDDMSVPIDKRTADSYLRIFGEIFEQTGHKAHYAMMMEAKSAPPRIAPSAEAAGIIDAVAA